ncbi:hypothetical protein EDC01DRAFT_451540 [Geopyxis carbonaria]|nr:hypothetical protein EDC01DRAFT_451540 [Geopyxis carbonaria]
MQFLSIRCLNCSNVDDLPRMHHDNIPYCSQCASTSNLVPEMPEAPKTPENNDTDMDMDLAAMFNRHLNLTYKHSENHSTPITPPSSSPTATNFSISQHYHHSSHLMAPPSPQSSEPSNDFDPVSAQLFNEATAHSAAQLAAAEQSRKDREYAEYLMGSDLSSPNSLNELQIAVAHGIISSQEYSNAVDALTHKAQIAQAAEAHSAMMQSKALEENCSAMDMLSAAARQSQKSDPVFRSSEWFNDYYGGVDQEAAMAMDDESPCSVSAWENSGGCRLQPFDY